MCNTGKWWILCCPSQEHTGWNILFHHFIKVCEIEGVIHSSVKYKNDTDLGRGEKCILLIFVKIIQFLNL